MTHGWPGSVIELLETVGPLTDPTAHGGSAEDAFHLVLPSIPGYGFSGEPAELGWDPGRVATRLGGADAAASATPATSPRAATWAPPSPTRWAARRPRGWSASTSNLLVTALGGPQPTESEQERAAADALDAFRATGFGYFLEQATRPQTIGYALLDSPVALAAWMLDHDTDSYYKISRAFVDGEPAGNLTRDHILDNITLYWLTGTGASAARSYWESGRAQAAASRPARLLRRSRFRSASPRSPTRSSGPRAAGSRTATRTSPTSTRSTRAATSPRGKSRSCSPKRCERPSSRFAKGARRLAMDRIRQAVDTLAEGHLPSFDGATGWLNSEPLTPEDLRGKVVLVDFWTYTCINWLRTLGYVRAWAEKYEDAGAGRGRRPHAGVPVRARRRQRAGGRRGPGRVEYPIALDTDYAVWRAFANHYWPAVYIADAEGRIRHHHFGEGGYDEQERVVQQLLGDRRRPRVRCAGGLRGSGGLVEPRLSRDLPRLRAGCRTSRLRRRRARRASQLCRAGLVEPQPVGSLR